MRIVTLEEHFVIPSLVSQAELKNPHGHAMKPEIKAALADLGPARIQAMDEGHVSLQVMSAAAPGADLLPGEAGIEFARSLNDQLYTSVCENPTRLAGFAHLPMRTPEAAASELKRTVEKLGFHGALINGTTESLFLDNPRFEPVLKTAEALDVPLYLHPALPPEPVRKGYYDDLPGNLGVMLSMAGFGWHIEVAIHVLRLALNGVFEKHPKLKIIIGHMGETLPFMLERAEQVFRAQGTPVKEKILRHVWITTSGFFSLPPFLNALQVFGADRILYSVDYPFSSNLTGWKFLNSLPVSPEDLNKIASGNADRLLKLGGH